MSTRKRSASTAGLEPAPTTKSRTRETERTGTAKEVQHHTVKGEKCTIIIDVTSTRKCRADPCRKTVHAEFTIRRPNKRTVKLGHVDGETIDKAFIRPDSTTAAWLEMLKPPPGYTGNLQTFGDQNDAVDDFRKGLIGLYTQKGKARSKFTHLQHQLAAKKMHYICHFELQAAFHGGSGFAQIAMRAYLTALGKLTNDHAVQGTVLLSPAAILTVFESKQKKAGVPIDWFEVVEKLIKSYGKCGFEVWLRASKTVKYSMTIMGQTIPQVAANLPASTMFPPRLPVREMANLRITPPDPSKTTAAAKKSYLWHGRYFAQTPDTDPAWIEEGKPKPRRVRHATYGLVDPDQYYALRAIVDETATHYLIQWEDDAETGESFENSWEPKANATADAVATWEASRTATR